MKTASIIADLVAKATRSRLAGKTVADRVTLIRGVQKAQVRSILLRSMKKGEEPAAIVAKVQKFYRSVDGAGGPAYMARRLVQTEITRFNGRVAVRMGQLINAETGRIPIYTYRTQGDDRVRDSHAELEGEEFTLDEYAEELGLRPLSEAEERLGEPNCRCWFDISFEGEGKGRARDTSPKQRGDDDEKAALEATVASAIRAGDTQAVVDAVKGFLGS